MRGLSSHFYQESKMDKIKIKSYGKVNLSLDVTRKRDDGYHEIQTIMQKISLFDDVTVTWTGREGKI